MKTLFKLFIKSLWRDGWLNVEFENNTHEEFEEWFNIQYKTRFTSAEKKQIES